MKTTTEQARRAYRQIRANAVKGDTFLTVERFDARARRLASELADGEEVKPGHWLQAATEIAYYASVDAEAQRTGIDY